MSFPDDLKLRWLTPDHPKLQGYETKILHHCLIGCGLSPHNLSGLTVFDPRDLKPATFDRLKARITKHPDQRFFLFYPQAFQHRVLESLKGPELKSRLEVYETSFLHLKQVQGTWSVRHKVRVVNVDDSPVLLKLLKHSIESRPSFEVVGQTSDSERASDFVLKIMPDVVTMDIQMPVKTGVEVVKELMSQSALPVLMVSSLSLEEGSLVFEALNAGAFDYLKKPQMESREEFIEDIEERLLQAAVGKGALKSLQKTQVQKTQSSLPTDRHSELLWLLGSSTGGTQALTQVLTSLPHHIPPILIVQHIPPLFSKAFAESVNDLVPFVVKEAEDNEEVLPNKVLIAPGGKQMGLRSLHGKLFTVVNDEPPVNRFQPSVDYLFERVAQMERTPKIIAGLLTGMGRDGAQGLKSLKEKGAMTLAQDEKSSAVFGMPRAAIEIGAAQHVVPLDQIAEMLLKLSLQSQNPRGSRGQAA